MNYKFLQNPTYYVAAVILTAALCMGSCKDTSSMICGLMVSLGLLILAIISNKSIRSEHSSIAASAKIFFIKIAAEEKESIAPLAFWFISIILIIAAVFTTKHSVDAFFNILGVLRLVTILLWAVLTVKLSVLVKTRLLKLLPHIASLIVFFSLILKPIKSIEEILWTKTRLCGPFLDSGAAALFFAIALMIQIKYAFDSRPGIVVKAIEFVLTIFGIILSGSKIVIVITILWLALSFFRTAKLRKPLAIYGGFTAVLTFCYYIIAGNLIKAPSNFTLAEPISNHYVYYTDAAALIADHPLGIGYMGYKYMIGLYQSSAYYNTFVHSDFIQTGIDYGVLSMLLLIAMVIVQLFNGRQSRFYKEILFLIAITSCVEQTMQCLGLAFLAVLVLDLGGENKIIFANSQEEYESDVPVNIVTSITIIAMLPAVVLFLYLSVFTFIGNYGDPVIAHKFINHYTPANDRIMSQFDDPLEAINFISYCLDDNNLNKEAYIYRAHAWNLIGITGRSYEDAKIATDLDPYNEVLRNSFYGSVNN